MAWAQKIDNGVWNQYEYGVDDSSEDGKEVEEEVEEKLKGEPTPLQKCSNDLTPASPKQAPEPFTIESLELLPYERDVEYADSTLYGSVKFGDEEHISLAECAYTRGVESDSRCGNCLDDDKCFKECVLIGEGKWTEERVSCFLKGCASSCSSYGKCLKPNSEMRNLTLTIVFSTPAKKAKTSPPQENPKAQAKGK